jgi:hypothetical protein
LVWEQAAQPEVVEWGPRPNVPSPHGNFPQDPRWVVLDSRSESSWWLISILPRPPQLPASSFIRTWKYQRDVGKDFHTWCCRQGDSSVLCSICIL